MAAMSVIGIDFGNESCYVAVAKAGGIETIANDYSLRATPTYVAFSEKNRILGVAAKNQQVTNMRNTIYGLKRLLGRKYSDKQVQEELKRLPFHTKQLADDSLGIEVRYLNESRVFTPEQCLAMLFTKLKDTSAVALETAVKDCVISVPSYYTHAERQALLDAAAIADLNVLCLLNETTATALAYGIYKQDLPAPEEGPRNVVFVDCGYASLQASACAFHRGQLKMLATVSDPNLGGRDVDRRLAEHFRRDFAKRYGVDAGTNQRAYVRLLAEVEKLKKQMSANSTNLPLNIECFMDDKDVHGEMKRAEMEEICKELFNRARVTLARCLQESGLSTDSIHSVEIVGGSTRISAIKQLISEVFGKTPSTTLNQDEAVSRGCALQCAILSPAVRVREFKVEDVQNYSIMLSSGPDEVHELFPRNTRVPIARKLTVNRSDSFVISAYYSEKEDIHFKSKAIGTWHIKDIKQIADGRSMPVKVTFNTNQSGIFALKKAVVECTEVVETGGGGGASEQQQPADKKSSEPQQQQQQQQQQPMDVDPPSAAAPDQNGDGSPQTDANNATAPENGDEKKKKKTIKKDIVLSIDAEIHGLTHKQVEELKEEEYKLIANDKREKERADARNALEEYVYELRGKLSSEEDLGAYILESDRAKLVGDLDSMENWLYEEGEDCERQQYRDRLASLKKRGEPVERRKLEAENRPATLDKLGRALQQFQKAYVAIVTGKDERAPAFTRDELHKAEKAIGELDEYLRQAYFESSRLKKHEDPRHTIEDMHKTLASVRAQVDPVLNKPRPKEPSPPKDAAKDKEKAAAAEANATASDDSHPDGPQNHEAAAADRDSEMHVDGSN